MLYSYVWLVVLRMFFVMLLNSSYFLLKFLSVWILCGNESSEWFFFIS